MSYPAYAEMKDSGIKWIGEVPQHWLKKKLNWLFNVIGSGTTPNSSNASYYEGEFAWINTGELNDGIITEAKKTLTQKAIDEHSALTLYPSGTLLIALYGATVGKVGILDFPATTNQACCALAIPEEGVDLKFVFYWFIANRPHIIAMAYGGGQPNISQELVKQLRIYLPPPDEQQSIVAFLGHKTSEINALINLKERQLELLNKKRQALISHIVLRGLDSSARLRPSTIAWLGDIPAHWNVKPLMYLTPSDRQIMYGIVLPGPNVEKGVPIVKSGDVAPHKLRLDKLCRTSHDIEKAYERSRLKAGDIVYSIRGSIGMAEIVPAELEGANLTQDAARVSPLDGVNRKWLLFALKSQPIFAQLEAGAVGATIRGINIRDLKRAYIPVPPEDEQQIIANYLDHESSRLDAQVEAIQAQIDKLRDYRQALISAAVTGKIDVRGETDDTVRGVDKKRAGRRG
jgi:type I restriction enzyme S subunit